jgi:hypothetical protein
LPGWRDRWAYARDHRRKPHVHPLRTPSGACLTTVEPDDHPWHRGLWFTIKYVNGDNFWEELPPYGVLRHRDAEAVEWIAPDRQTVVIDERRRLTHVDLDAAGGAYAIDVDLALLPRVDVVLDRTEFTTWGGYGGLTLRGRPDWTGTRLLLPDGTSHERVLGECARWCDLSGDVDGGSGGVAFLDHPANPSHPVPWYASTRAATYGDAGWSNFLNAAFLWDGPLTVAAGEELRFAYRVVVHDGTWDAERVESCYRRWVE